MSYEIKIPFFEGPFDLLLFFIERDEIDIHDIPITKITQDFLDYIRNLNIQDIEVASEFILVAATLMQIKAKMLLPRLAAENLSTEEDPRNELVKHLIEYKKYKSVLFTFSELEEKRLLLEKRGNIEVELKSIAQKTDTDSELQDLDLYKLFKVYQKVLTRFENEKNKPVHTVLPYPYTMDGQKEFILNALKQTTKLSFSEIITEMPFKIAVIFNFLSILELLQSELIQIILGEGYNNFWIINK
jgi:segregation and condensation protein A